MAVTLTDTQIEALLAEEKPLPADYARRLQTKPKRGHDERELEVEGIAGNKFRIILRQSQLNIFDFSIILSWQPPEKTANAFRLRRYNGKAHEHSNALDGDRFYDFHIHYATARYQAHGYREDTYAVVTDRYSSLQGAIQCLIADCSFQLPSTSQFNLFHPQGHRDEY
jgi:hypothetical protein